MAIFRSFAERLNLQRSGIAKACEDEPETQQAFDLGRAVATVCGIF